MFLLPVLLIAVQFCGIIAAPLEARNGRHGIAKGIKGSSTTSSAAAAATSAATTPEAEEKGDELNLNGVFGTAVALGGGNVKTDVLFTKGSVGSLEVEFQDAKANSLTVTENKTPGKAPTGFALLDPSTYKIALKDGAANLTLQKVDFIFDPTSEFLFFYFGNHMIS